MKQQIPDFQNEDEERAFWAEHDSADYLDWSQAKPMIFPEPKLSINADRCIIDNSNAS